MDSSPVDIFVARQPIFDRDRQVRGYELLYRSGTENRFAAGDSDVASAQNLERTLLNFGLQKLTGSRDAYVNASRTTLVNDHWTLMPAAQTVVELLETVEPDAEVASACARLRSAGYRLALDDFTYRAEYEPLLRLASIVKVDFRAHGPAERQRLTREISRHGAALLAEKIETHEEFQQAVREGYVLFQGYFFCRPEMMRTRSIAPNRVAYLRLLREVHSAQIDFPTIEGIIQQDVALSLKLLRFMQSAAFGWAKDVRSIRQAMLIMGERALRKWAALVAVFGLAQGKPSELVIVALSRARFAEKLGPLVGLQGHELDLFLSGLLSVVDALTDTPLDEALATVAVPESVRSALLDGGPPLGDALHLVLAWERGQWDEVERWLRRLGPTEVEVAAIYADAVLWAEDHAQP